MCGGRGRFGLTGGGEFAQAFLDGGEVAVLRGFRHSGADGVEIHVDHAGQYCGIVKECLGFEAPLPESPRAVVLPVGLAGDGFVQHAHEPGDVGEALTPLIDDLGDLVHLGIGGGPATEIALDEGRQAEQLRPAVDHLALAPGGGGPGVDVEDEVVVVAHHSKGADVHAEDGGEGFHLGDQPLAAVFVVLAGEGVEAAEKSAADAAGDAVVVRGIGEADLGGSGGGHGIKVAGRWWGSKL